MTRIDFHSNVPDKIQLRLPPGAQGARRPVPDRAAGARRAELAALDAALWTFSDRDFLPHVQRRRSAGRRNAGDPDWTKMTGELPHHQVLINLSDRPPAHFARFERMFEIIGSDEADLQAGRERYRFYKQRGYSLTHFVAESA